MSRSTLANKVDERLLSRPRDEDMARYALVVRDALYDGVMAWLAKGVSTQSFEILEHWRGWLLPDAHPADAAAAADDLVIMLRNQLNNASKRQIDEYEAYFRLWNAARREAKSQNADQVWPVWAETMGAVVLSDSTKAPFPWAAVVVQDPDAARIEAFRRMLPIFIDDPDTGEPWIWEPWVEWQRAEDLELEGI